MVVLTRTGDAAPTRQDVEIDDACQDRNFANVDANKAVFGEFGSPASVAVISRPDATSPWAVTRVAPSSAPGLVVHEGRLYTQYFTAPGPRSSPSAPAGAGRCVPRCTTRSPRCGVLRPRCSTSRSRCRWGGNGTDQPARGPRRGREVRGQQRRAHHPRRSRLAGAADGSARARAVPGRPVRRRARAPPAPTSSLPTGASSPCRVAPPGGATSPCRPVRTRPSCSSRDSTHGGGRCACSHLSADGTDRLGRSRAPTPGGARRSSSPGTGPPASRWAARASTTARPSRWCVAAAGGRCGSAAGDLTTDARTPPAGGPGAFVVRRAGQPLRAVICSVAAGSTECRSPTTPKSTSSKIGASGSLLTATIVFEVCMPARCWIAPEMPLAT